MSQCQHVKVEAEAEKHRAMQTLSSDLKLSLTLGWVGGIT